MTLRPEEGGEGYELLPGGATQSVTPENVYQYVKLYAELRMVRVCQEALQVGEGKVACSSFQHAHLFFTHPPSLLSPPSSSN